MRQRRGLHLLLPWALVGSLVAYQESHLQQPLALTHVTVVDVRDGALVRDSSVLIRGNWIVALGTTGELDIPRHARVVDAAGQYLIPGLWDMHVHAMYEGRPELFFPMFVANGVTGVREMASTFSLSRIGRIRDQIARGDVLGPRFGAVAGKIFEGPVPPDTLGPEFISVSTPDQAREIVRSYKRDGADFIKVYSRLPRDVYLAIADEARRQGMPFAGHAPESVDPREVLDAGQRSIEHLTDPPLECFASDASELRMALVEQGVPAAEIDKRIAEYESADCASLFALYARNETWHVPTLVVVRTRLRASDPALLNDQRRTYIPPARREEWKEAMASRQARTPEPVSTARWRQALKLVGAMHRAGAPMLAGSDTGLGNAYTFAGFSLHDELALLVEAGFTRLEALQAATLNPARSLDMTDSLGTIEPSKLADLVLLDGNPLEDIRNTQKIAAVVLNGRYLDRQALDDLLAAAERAANRSSDTLVEAVVYTTLRPPNWDIYLFDKPGGAPRRLTNDPALDYNAVFSPDGRWVVFTSERTGNTDLYALDLKDNGPPVRLTHHHGMDDAASFSPDGRRLVFVSTREGDADIFVMPFAPGDSAAEQRAVNLTRRPGGDFNPAFSPDDRHIAFSRQERWDDLSTPAREDMAVELYLMDVDGSNVRRLSTPGVGLSQPGSPDVRLPLVSGSPAWSRDGKGIYYYRLGTGGFEIRRVALDGSGDAGVAPNGFSPAVRPDGRVAFVRPAPDAGRRPESGDVVSVAPGSSTVRIETDALESCFAPDFDRGSGRMLCHGPGPIDGFVTLRDGRAFAPPDAIRHVHLPDRTLTVRGIRGFFPALTPSGDVISTLRGISAAATRAGLTDTMTVPLHVSAVDGGGRRELFAPPSGVAWGASVAREAGWVVVAVGPPFAEGDTRVDIWKLRLDGSAPVNLTPESAANDALPHISRDGRRIVFRSSRDGNMAIYVMDGEGKHARRVTEAAARETMPALSPDGEWVVFATHGTNGGKLWLQRVDGSERRLLEPDRSHIADFSLHPRFSPDGNWVVFTSDRAGFNDEWPLTGAPQPYGELWAVPVAGGAAVRLTQDKWEDGPNDWGYVRRPDRRP